MLNNSWQANWIFFSWWGKVQVISVLLGKTKLKTNKLHLGTCSLNQSQLQFHFLSNVGIISGHCSMCLVLLRFRLGREKGARQKSVKKAFPGVNASWLCRVNIHSLVFSLNWWLTCSLWRCCCNEHKQNSRSENWWGGEALTHNLQRAHSWNSKLEERLLQETSPTLPGRLADKEVPGCCCWRWDVEEGNKRVAFLLCIQHLRIPHGKAC